MASNYPGSLDSFDTIAADKKQSDTVGGRTHRAMHNDLGDAIESVQTELGANPSGSDATVAARLAAIEAGTNLAAGAVGTSDIADGAVTNVKLGSDVRIGNLLTANQASVETDTTGLGASGTVSISRETAYALHGSASLRCEVTSGTGAIDAGIPAGTSSAVPVTAGQTYTYTLSLRPINTQYFRLYVVYRGADGTTYVDESMAPTTSCPDSTWTTLTYTHTAPAGAYYAHFWVYTDTSTVGQRFNLDCLGVWRGASGQWAMPGTVIPGTSHIAVNGAFQTSGTVAPEGAITAPPLSRYLQTSGAATATGAQEWVKDYGTGPTGWVAGAEADTGHRNIYASVANGQTNDCRLRRWGNLVELVVGVSGYTDAAVAYTLPTGFRPSAAWMSFVAGTATVQTQVVARSGSGEVLFYGAGGSFTGVITFLTFDPWPSSLPGSAA